MKKLKISTFFALVIFILITAGIDFDHSLGCITDTECEATDNKRY